MLSVRLKLELTILLIGNKRKVFFILFLNDGFIHQYRAINCNIDNKHLLYVVLPSTVCLNKDTNYT